MPLGETAEARYGAPYWAIHRGDLQAALVETIGRRLDVTLKLGVRVEDFVAHPNGITVSARSGGHTMEERGFVLIGADGLWSAVRQRLSRPRPPRFAGRTAWRALVPVHAVAPEFRTPVIHLWLGRDAHLVHYPVKSGEAINIVVITGDHWNAHGLNAQGWSEPASRADLVPRLAARSWVPQARALVALPEAWLKWALYDRPPLRHWSKGPVALLGDAAHPTLPFLAQGAAMAIEDAAVVAHCLAQNRTDPAAALQAYCATRRGRARKVAQLAARNGTIYHLAGASGLARDIVMHGLGGERLLHRYDWIYGWRPPTASGASGA